jgi:hypothetical protein
MEKEEARNRAQQLRAFREELATFEQDGVFDRDQMNLDRLDSYQRRMLAELARLEDAEAAAARKRFRRRLCLVLLFGMLVAGAALCWSILSGHLSPGEIWQSLSSRVTAFMQDLLPS